MPRITLATVAAILTAVAGAVGTVLVPLCGQELTTVVQGILQGLAGILLAIPAYATAHVAAAQAKARADVAKAKAMSDS